mgnify:CR=1 FL=1
MGFEEDFPVQCRVELWGEGFGFETFEPFFR